MESIIYRQLIYNDWKKDVRATVTISIYILMHNQHHTTQNEMEVQRLPKFKEMLEYFRDEILKYCHDLRIIDSWIDDDDDEL